MEQLTRSEAIQFLLNEPYELGRMVGFSDLRELHNEWIRQMVLGEGDQTLQAHRGSYKTTCVSIALAIIILLFPNDKTLFMRKTDSDVKEVIVQVKNILVSGVVQEISKVIYNNTVAVTNASSTSINTSLKSGVKGTAQLVGMGVNSSLTGKHFDRIFTDDIVNIEDRISHAEREHTKLIYQELQNIKNRNGRIFNTGTPWHKEDCFELMPNIEKYDCYTTGLINDTKLDEIKRSMLGSLFAANYELKHIADEDAIFTDPYVDYDASLAEQGIAHIDAAYYGADYTAFTVCKKTDGKYYIFGKIWRKHVEDVEDDIIRYRKQFKASKIYCEINSDKGYLAKDLRRKGERVIDYGENMNKFIKITSYLKDEWENVYFVKGTDKEYIEQVCDYNENADHDDAPDSLASAIRVLWKKKSDYIPIWNV